MLSKALTINDVAEAAGVSYQTVSRVINQSPHVAVKTRKRVQNTIDRLGYRPNDAARKLAAGRSSTIGIISFASAYYGPWQVLTSIEATLKQKGYSLHISFIDDPETDTFAESLRQMNLQQLEGIILITPIAELDFGEMERYLNAVPHVLLDIDRGKQFASVLIDQQYGMNLAVEHLIKLGHSKIASISGPLNWAVATSRQHGLNQALSAAGLDLVATMAGDWSVQGGYEATSKLLGLAREFTALVVGNDHMALGAYRALKEQGLGVPEDVSVIGFDDIPEASFFEPPLTTVRQDFTLLGQQCVNYLLSIIEHGSHAAHQRVLYPELVVRSSTNVSKRTL